MNEKYAKPSNSNVPRAVLIFGLFWTAFSSFFLILGLRDGDTAFTAVGLLFVGIGVAMLGYGLIAEYTRLRVGKPEIIVSKTTLAVGEEFTFNLTHQFKRPVNVTSCTTTLIFREIATYQQGTDTRTVTHDHIVQDFEEPVTSFNTGQFLSLNYTLQIPRNSMHSLDVRRNKLEWLLRFQLGIPRLPDFIEEIKLTVLPQSIG